MDLECQAVSGFVKVRFPSSIFSSGQLRDGGCADRFQVDKGLLEVPRLTLVCIIRLQLKLVLR